MNLNKKSIVYLMLCAAIMLILLTSCSRGEGGETTMKSTTDTAEKENRQSIIESKAVGSEKIGKKTPQAEIKMVNGYPQLYINNQGVVPEMPFVNADIPDNWQTNMSQIRHAAVEGNIHLHQTNAYVSPVKKDGEYDFSILRSSLATVVGGDPDGYIIIRLWLGENSNFNLYEEGERIVYADGTRGDQISIASDKWLVNTGELLEALIEYIRSDPDYGPRVVGYILTAAETGEWFQYLFRQKGADVSRVNTIKFQQWLKKRYKNAESLQKAWQKEDATFENAQIPADLLGHGWKNTPYTLHVRQAGGQRAVDYKDYYGELTVSRIKYLAGIVKKASKGESLVGAFYGYTFEIPDAVSGHFSLEQLLECEDIDFLGSPVSYQKRNEGEIGPSMSLIETIHAHGKLWFDECDYRSPVITQINSYGDGFSSIKTFEALIEVYRRQMGFQMLKATGGWPMDLFGKGWYDSADFWQEIGKLKNLYDLYEEVRPGPAPEVALIVDEKAFSLIADVLKVSHSLAYKLRHELYTAGVNFGTYLMSDLEKGLVPDAKLYIINSPFRISSARADKLAAELHQPGKTALWMYGFGSTAKSDIKKLTGMDIYDTGDERSVRIKTTNAFRDMLPDKIDKILGTGGKSCPLWAAKESDDIRILGKTGKAITFAEKEINGSNQIFFGSYILDNKLIRALGRYAGANIYTDEWDACMANQNMLVIHTGGPGKRNITFPGVVDVYEQFSGKWYAKVDSIKLDTPGAKTYMFFYGARKELQDAGIGR